MDSRCGCSWSMTTRSCAGGAPHLRERGLHRPGGRARRRGPGTPRDLPSGHRGPRLVLPDLSGFDVCREIRRAGHRMPVIILSAKHDEIDVVLGLEIGADDYIAKPFRPRELLARIGAHLRKAKELRGDDKPAGRPPRLPRPRHRHRGAARDPRRSRHRPHPHRVRPPLVPGVERRQGALPRADPQRGLGLRAPHRDAGSSTSTSAICAARSSPTRRNRATSSPSRASATASPGSDADGCRGSEGAAKYTRHGAYSSDARSSRALRRRAGRPTPSRRSPSEPSRSSPWRCSPPPCSRPTPTRRPTSSCPW